MGDCMFTDWMEHGLTHTFEKLHLTPPWFRPQSQEPEGNTEKHSNKCLQKYGYRVIELGVRWTKELAGKTFIGGLSLLREGLVSVRNVTSGKVTKSHKQGCDRNV